MGSELFVMARNDFTVSAKMTKLTTGEENIPNQVSVLTLLGNVVCQTQRSKRWQKKNGCPSYNYLCDIGITFVISSILVDLLSLSDCGRDLALYDFCQC